MRAGLARFFDHVNIFRGKRRLGAGFVVLANQIRQMQGAGEARGSSADDQDVRIEALAFNAHNAAYLSRSPRRQFARALPRGAASFS